MACIFEVNIGFNLSVNSERARFELENLGRDFLPKYTIKSYLLY
jgi:hypothetical protein